MDVWQSNRITTAVEALRRPLKLHFIPFLAAGHMTPLCEMARSFAAYGHHVTIITTALNAISLENDVHLDIAAGHCINIHTLQFPSEEVGLPDGVENLTAVTDNDSLLKVCRAATSLLQKSFEDFVLQNPPDCLVADFMYPWAHDLAARLGIPRLVFNSFCVFSVCVMESIKKNPITGQDPHAFTIPDLPLPITMNIRPPIPFLKAIDKPLELEAKSYGLLVNNFVELDGVFVEHYNKITGHKVWHIGPTALIHRTEEETAKGTHKNEPCMSWLESRKPDSVIYICFGSSGTLPDNQLYEIACAMESCGHSFIWVVPGKDEAEKEEEKERWLPKGFEERMMKEEKGLILRGWAPQVKILGHAAVGGFMTHCGWNSVVESVGAGVPMVTWPLHSDQFYNEKLVTQVQGVGVEVGVEEWGVWVLDERKKTVKRDRIEKAVRRLMDEGEEGEEMRRRARELGEKAREAVKEGGSSHENLKTLIRELQETRDSKLVNAT
ncbi:UDP-glucose flavonoid 3-O-glucosyltransferase 7-like [Neltuma alba]|uniref:UDP-glucose flavonoid 3-O-glucosyltransferase 7-like n=1 Tax=Neltuma alba TaxID=207710 RepID=UPI0010A4CD70|nr:UDP-glucose flavonoid 3-O-glucosyltransferase 7-like [Prosopis alba]